MKDTQLKNIIAFCALMENGDGILDKSPAYVIEKFKRYCLSDQVDETPWGLDKDRKIKVFTWWMKWMLGKKKAK